LKKRSEAGPNWHRVTGNPKVEIILRGPCQGVEPRAPQAHRGGAKGFIAIPRAMTRLFSFGMLQPYVFQID
jgi:hypothetical protein